MDLRLKDIKLIKYLLAIALAVTPAFSQTQVIYDPIGGRLIGGIPIGGGTGTVTSVSVTTANGLSGVVANPTTTPAITLTLGAITPSSVAATGTITGPTLGVGPSNTSLGTLTGSILDRTPTTGVTSLYIGSDNNGHTSATTTQVQVLAGAAQSTTPTLLTDGISQFGPGSVTVPSVRFGTDTGGWYRSGSNQWTWLSTASTPDISIFSANLRMQSAEVVGWTPTSSLASSDTGLSRDAAGAVAVGTGSAGSSLGRLKLAGIISAGTKFTTSGCSVSATTGGATAGTLTSGTTGACTVVITLNGATGITAPNGWACHGSDLTTPANLISQSATSATTCTITGTTVSGDVLTFLAMAY